MFRKELMFIPLSTVNLRVDNEELYTGYKLVFIFGIRIMKLQLTKPWRE